MLDDVVLSQKREHNQLAFVSRLPNEVFGEIFGYLQSRTDREWNEPGYPPSLLWIPEVTHVCHAWREVALHTAFLWQEIDVTASPSWALEFYSRSKNALLCITASNSEADTDEKMHPGICSCTEKIVQAAVERVQEIALDRLSVSSVLRILSPRSSLAADERITFPVLQHLGVSTLDTLILTDDSVCAPSLTSLEVRDFCSVDWKALSLLQNLSYLDLSIYWDRSVADLDAIYKAFCQMPNLEELTICPEECNTEPEAIISPAPDQTVTLPKLRSIHLRSHFPIWLSSILHCIAGDGPQRDLSISAVCDVTDVKELFSNIPAILQPHVKESSIRSLQIQFYTTCIYLWGWRSVKNSWVPVVQRAINITIQIPMAIRLPTSYPFGLSVYLLNKLLAGLNFRRLTSLSLSFLVPIPAETWVRLFGSLPDLSMIFIRLGLCELCAALVDGIPDNSQLASTTDRIIPFRALQSIHLEYEKGYFKSDSDHICTRLRKRLDLKVPLKELHINFDEDVKDHGLDVGTLKESVGCVVIAKSSK